MRVPARVVLASANPKKVAELASILDELAVTTAAGEAVELLPRPVEVPEVVEDAPDFVGNARLKALALARATDEAALADDSGLEVDTLSGAPGVHSARYAGDDATDEANVALLLAELDRVGAHDPERRRARFRCVLVLMTPGGEELVAEGTVEGHIAARPVGDGGFGYDPVFVPDGGGEGGDDGGVGDGRTFAQMSSSEKQQISHRGRALRSLVASLVS